MSQEPKAVVGIFDCNGDRVVIPDDKSDKVQVTIYDREGKPLHVTPVEKRHARAGASEAGQGGGREKASGGN
jgi:hypothetical protein